MELNKLFEFEITSTKLANVFKTLGNTISSSQTKKIYYRGCGLEVKRNRKITLLFLAKKENGFIIYVCNGVYTVGEFMFFTNKEVKVITETFTITENKEKYNIEYWRLLYYYESVISEFVDPKEAAELRYKKSLTELKYKIVEKDSNVLYLQEVKKRYK